jgi:8-oxo-dGTP pyrophosphatase MutT (NUDIX family)
MPGTAPIPALAATLLLLRDGPGGLEVLMMCRSEASSFAPGAYVFPGGRVGPEDEVLARFCAPCDAADSAALARRIAAIRETYEECGILLARRPAGALLSSVDVRPGMSLTDGSLELATDLVVPFAHWITPASRPKRFDTWFFLAAAPADQVAAHDGHEATDTVWVRPADVLAKADAEAVKLVFVTRMNIIKLGRSRTVAEAIAAAASSSIVAVTPEVVQTADGPAFQIPEAADYGVTHLLVGNIPRA